MSTWLLVHPPLLGPAVLGPLAAELRARGHAVAVPDLRGAVDRTQGWYDRYTELAAAAGPAEVVLGFSGAGVVLPAVAAAAGARRVVWLDAVVPARTGETHTPAARRAAVAALTRDGRITPWPTWWTPEELAAELPDEALRAAVGAEARELPGDFYDVGVPVPDAWPDGDVSYVQLSGSYDADAAEARARGWTVAGDGTGSHLDVATRPRLVVDLVDRTAAGRWAATVSCDVAGTWQRGHVDRDTVMQWVAGYERAWRDGDVSGVTRLFTEDARYRSSPYEPARVGHEEIQAFWRDDEGRTFSVTAEPVAVEGRDAVVRLEVRYHAPVEQEYRDLWVLRFAPDGRVEDFEEWAYWPGRPYSAESDITR